MKRSVQKGCRRTRPNVVSARNGGAMTNTGIRRQKRSRKPSGGRKSKWLQPQCLAIRRSYRHRSPPRLQLRQALSP